MKEVSPVTFNYKDDSIMMHWQIENISLRQHIQDSKVELTQEANTHKVFHKEEAYVLV